MDSPIPPRSEEPELAALLERVGPRLKRILYRFRIPARDADTLLEETLLILVSKQGSVRSADAWLLATLSNRCVLYWRGRRSRAWELVDRTLLELLAEDDAPPEEREEIRSDLDDLIAQLPPRCQTILRMRYGLTVPDMTDLSFPEHPKATRRCLSALGDLVLASGLLEPPRG
ncbi:MAG TPA: sigma-70 family RNA polymerase sigma factor [Thermoanaerobaculia bacterium]|nr:sigma-70 family RNA polymerase sigma factor [Thermoanaerobaculia bacterium]